MIRFEQMGVTYHGATHPTLRNIDLTVHEGELCLVVGPTGTGKSTLLRTINGLVPHFTGGALHGRVVVDGRDTATHPPREMADLIGVVGQDPRAGFVTDTVEEELAYGMESLAIPSDVMRRRVEETLDLLGLAELRDRPLDQLSGGQRQRVAIGAVLSVHPKVLVLDEPTSALDPPAAEEVLAALQRLVHDLGITVVLAEHRLERVVQYADRIVELPGGGAPVRVGDPAEILHDASVAPPVVQLARSAGWSPVPLSIRDARRRAGPLRERLAALPGPGPGPGPGHVTPQGGTGTDAALGDRPERDGRNRDPALAPGSPPTAEAHDLTVTYGARPALRGVDLTLHPGEVVALMGRNGAGKSTLLHALTGGLRPQAGRVRLGDDDPAQLPPRRLIGAVGLVPQEPADLLYAESVAAECAAADRDAARPAGSSWALLDRLVPGLEPTTHPRDLSEGQRLGLVLAIVLVSDPPVLLLDEPTRGLDYAAKQRLVTVLRALAAEGRTIVLATHDVELAAAVATRTVVLAEGEIVVDGPTAEVVVGSPAFAPQVAKVLAPLPWLTVEQVVASLEVAS